MKENIPSQIVLFNPHLHDLIGTLPYFYLRGRYSSKKYGFLIGTPNDQKVKIFLDYTASSVVPSRVMSLLPKFIRKLIVTCEFKLWLLINDMSSRYVLYTSQSTIPPDYVLLMFAYVLSNSDNLSDETANAVKPFTTVVAHMSHYFLDVKEKSSSLKKINNIWLAGDSDISENPFFKNYFAWYEKQFLVLPFYVQARFRCLTQFSTRDRRCIASGTIVDIANEINKTRHVEFEKFYQTNCYHPLREAIYKNKNLVSENIYSLVNYARGEGGHSSLMKYISKYGMQQKNYFKKDIVALYNSFKFAVVGEELPGFPALGIFEAMACGCVAFANPVYYNGLNLRAGIHYIAHDGTLENLIEKIVSVKDNDSLILNIANNGMEYVKLHLAHDTILNTWKNTLKNL